MKKRLLSLMLACTLLLSLSPAAVAATNSIGMPLNDFGLTCTISYKTTSGKEVTQEKSVYAADLDTILGALAAGKYTLSNVEYTIDSTQPYTILVGAKKVNSPPVTGNTSKKVVITANTPTESTLSDETYTICNSSSEGVTVQSVHKKANLSHNITFDKGLEIQSGATLTLKSSARNQSPNLNYTFSDDVVVNGTLQMIGNAGGQQNINTVSFGTGASLIVSGSGKATIEHMKLTGGSKNDPLIQNSGTLELAASGYHYCEIETTGTAIKSSTGTVTMDGASIKMADTASDSAPLVIIESGTLTLEQHTYSPLELQTSTTSPAITVADGATLTLKGGEIKATGTDTPAVQVAAGATVEIPTDSKTIVTASSNNSQAIDLADGATVKKGDIVTVVVSDTNGSDNYVDNNGNIILAKGAKTGESENQTLNAAVILPDGTLIQGSEDTAPSVTTTNGNTTVTIPAGGSVQKPDGTTQNLTAGGTATSTPKDDGGTDTKLEVTAVPVTNVNLNQANLSLREGSTATLTATVEPADATNKNVTWTSSDQKVATVDANGTVTAVAPGTAIITAAAGEKTATCTVTVTKPSSGSSGSGSSSTTTQTTTNPDGSTTTTVTNKKTGTVTETTKYKDGSTLAVETKKDGTVTTTATAVNGVKTVTVEKPGEKVTAAITLPAGVDAATVTIPADLTPGTVAVDTKTGEIVMLSVPTEDGMLIKVEGSAKLVLEDRSKDFIDTPGHWGEDAIDFAVAHEMFNGTSETTFTPDGDMTRAMLMTVLARFDGQDTTGGETWYEKGMEWAKANGVSDGANPNAPITREQLVTMLYRYVGSPAADGSLASFPDAGKVSAYAADAMTWAVGTGILNGMGDGTLAPQGSATRAQVATILMRFCENVAK